VSCVSTAFVQPYETAWLNLLDTFGLFTLIVTQILSIVYFYAATAADPIADPAGIEITVTTVLFAANLLAILVFFGLFASESIGVREMWNEKRSTALWVASAEHTRAALAAPDAVNERQLWHHPSGIAVPMPPKFVGDDEEDVVQIWPRVGEMEKALSMSEVELLIVIDDVKSLPAGATFRWMHNTTRAVSDAHTVPPDVGGVSCFGGKVHLDDRPDVELHFMHHNQLAANVVEDSSDDSSSDSDSDSEASDDSDSEVHPRGWSALVTEEGDTYYHNDHTRQTTWEKPQYPAPPHGWEIAVGEAGLVQYLDVATGMTQLHHPHDKRPEVTTHASGVV